MSPDPVKNSCSAPEEVRSPQAAGPRPGTAAAARCLYRGAPGTPDAARGAPAAAATPGSAGTTGITQCCRNQT